MEKSYIGIDPGQKGGITVISDEIYSFEMLLTPNKEIDCRNIFLLLENLRDNENYVFCVIEKSQSMSKQGVKSTFNYGRGYGELLAILKILEIPFQEISSMKWKKEFSLIKKTKKDSVSIAKKLNPIEKFETKRGRLMDGKAESFLIAEWGRRKNL